MELDELRQAWQALGRQLERHDALQLRLLRERRLDRARRHLRPLAWGQALQILVGAGMVALAALLWASAPAIPAAIAAGVCVHLYGLATIAAAGLVLSRLRAIDYAAPVAEIVDRTAALRRAYVASGMIAGLPWWVLPPVLLVLLAGLRGVDLAARAPWLVWPSLGLGACALLASWGLHRWLRDPRRAALRARLGDFFAGPALRRHRRALDEAGRIGRE